jgi:hypothetical protein
MVEQRYEVKLAAPRAAIEAGGASGAAERNPFARVRQAPAEGPKIPLVALKNSNAA